MAFVDENTGAAAYNWETEGIYQLEDSDPVQGGVGGVSNAQALALAKRTRNLHTRIKDIVDADFLGTVRGGVANTLNTLEKLRLWVEDRNPESIDVEALKLELRGNVDAALDNMEAIVEYIDGLSYLPTFRGTSVLAGTTIDWRGTPEMTKTLTAATQLDASNLIAGKTIRLLVSGAFALTFSTKFKKAVGSFDPSTTLTNYVQMVCVNATSGSEIIIYSIIYVSL